MMRGIDLRSGDRRHGRSRDRSRDRDRDRFNGRMGGRRSPLLPPPPRPRHFSMASSARPVGGRDKDLTGLTSVKIDNLPPRTQYDDLQRAFSEFGEIGDIYIPRDHIGSRGFGFVRFYDVRDAMDATKNGDGLMVHGMPLRVSMAKYDKSGRKDRSRSPPRFPSPRKASGRDRGRSSGRDRDRSKSPKRFDRFSRTRDDG